ncbi:MAG TPA: transglycosylase domain-containing protein [Longimicrobiaceae bacterium]|nr:transglycosylase domain-containing protein [Longimicrobiaceae bacterium]
MKAKRGKLLQGKPKRAGKWTRQPRQRRDPKDLHLDVVGLSALGLFIIGLVIGYGWALDRQIRGGILEQRVAAQQRADWVSPEELPAYIPAAFRGVVNPSAREAGRRGSGIGGTTLARDLVRQVHQLGPGPAGEARELAMGPILENRTSPEGLLELYLNRVHLGDLFGYPIYGIEHAAEEYFGTHAQDLTLSQAATLAGILLPPRIARPEQMPGAVGARRNEVLRYLYFNGDITADQYRAAIVEKLGFQPGIDKLPMTRPADFGERIEVIRLPPSPPQPDSTASS